MNRNTLLKEKMDDPNCDKDLLANTYRQFSLINLFLCGWGSLYKKHIQNVLKNSDNPSLLDIGFGGGDLAIRISKWAKEDGINLKITAIDSDPRALEFVKNAGLDKNQNISFKASTLEQIADSKFDVVISNHLLHHIEHDVFKSFLDLSAKTAKKLVIHNDLRRSRLAYFLHNLNSVFFRNSFIIEDGRTSILRAFTKNELALVAKDQWQVSEVSPFRVLAILKK